MAGKVWSVPALKVLSLFGNGEEMHGYAVAKRLNLKEPLAYKILARMEADGLLTSKTERVSHLAPRVPRVVYQGTTCAADELQHLREIVGA